MKEERYTVWISYSPTTPPPPSPNTHTHRVQPGQCFHLFTKLQLSKMADFQLPEMLRTPLEELVLQIKILGLGKVMPFLAKAIEPPSNTAVENALECLKELVSVSCAALVHGGIDCFSLLNSACSDCHRGADPSWLPPGQPPRQSTHWQNYPFCRHLLLP